MPAKDLIFDESARRQLKSGIDALAQRRQGHARPARPQRRHRQEVGRRPRSPMTA